MQKLISPPALAAVVAAAALSLAAPAGAQAGVGPSAGAHGPGSGRPAPHPTSSYFTGDYTPSLELYSFNNNLTEWIKNRPGAPPMSTPEAIDWAAQAGFPAVDITAYYIPGYEADAMPSKPTAEIMQYARDLKAQCARLGLQISGTGVGNDFADADPAVRALDVRRTEFWTDFAAELGAPVIRVFSGPRPSDIHQLGWENVARTRVVPALKEVTAYAATKGVKVVLQNHGDMTATADQTIQIMKWVDDPNLKIIDDTGYFMPFGSENQQDYDWYRDIAKVAPYSDSIQAKLQPAGAGTTPAMDFDRLFTDLRLTNYRGYIPMERLWAKDDPDNPKKLPTPPYDQVSAFYAKVKAGLADSKVSPFTALATAIDNFARTHQLSSSARARLGSELARAYRDYTAGRPADAMASMQDFLAQLDRAPGRDVADAARQALGGRMTTLLQSFHDVFGWPVSLTDTVPSSVASTSTVPFTATVTNRTGATVPSTRTDITILPVNPTPSGSHPTGDQPVELSPGEATLQMQVDGRGNRFVDVPLTQGPDGSLVGHLDPATGTSLKPGRDRAAFRLSFHGAPAGYLQVDLSLGQVDGTGAITAPGIATAATAVDVG
jgi:sugar phosphate isomerase/epimerase